MTVSITKTTEELDSARKGRELPSAGNAVRRPRAGKQGRVRDGSGTFGDVETRLGSRIQKDYNGAWPQTGGPVRQQLCRAKVKQTELILFTTQLSVMLDSGVVLSDALDAIAEQAEHETFKMIIKDVSETVKSGENFSKALTVYPKVFNSMFISMVKASEASGRMVETHQRSTYISMYNGVNGSGGDGYADVLCSAEVYEDL